MVLLKRSLIILSIFLTSLIFFGCRNEKESYNVSNEDNLILRLAETQPSNYPSTIGDIEFARLVEKNTAGRIKVKVYESGKLGDESSVVEQVQFGGIDLARVSLASLTNYSNKAKVTMLPYQIESRDRMWPIFDGPIGQEIKAELFKEKILCLAWYDGGARSFYNSKKRIVNVEDLKGLKIGVQHSQMLMDIYSCLGVSLVPTKPNGIYNAIQTGFIDGAENNLVSYYLGKHYEVAKNLTYDEHIRVPEVLIASRVATMQLSKKDKAIIEQAAQESAQMQRRVWLNTEVEALKTLNELGVTVTYLDENNRKKFLEAVQPIFTRFKREDIVKLNQY